MGALKHHWHAVYLLPLSPSLSLVCQCSRSNDRCASLSVSKFNVVLMPPGPLALAACRSLSTHNGSLKAFQGKRTGQQSEIQME